MKVAEIKALSADELNARITDTRKEIVDLRFQLGARKLDKPHKIRDARKLLSMLATVQKQTQPGPVKYTVKFKTRAERKRAAAARQAAK